MIRGIICTTVMGLLAALASPAMGAGKCGEGPCAQATASPCAAPCAPRISGTACGDPCPRVENDCEPRCKTVAGACGECSTTCKMPKVDADIEKLKVVNPKCSRDLCVEWQVDIDNMCGPYDLIIQVKDDCDAIVYERVVALEGPYHTEDDGSEQHFRGTYTDVLADAVAFNGKLKAEGNVVPRGTRASVDRERERVRTSDRDHGFATPLYTAADVVFTPVSWIARPLTPRY